MIARWPHADQSIGIRHDAVLKNNPEGDMV